MPDLETELLDWRSKRNTCPTPDLLLAAEEGVLPEELGQSVIAHRKQCPLCRQLAADLESEDFVAPGLAETHRMRKNLPMAAPRARWHAPLSIAAAVTVGILGYVAMRDRGAGPAGPGPAPPVAKISAPRIPIERIPLRLRMETAVVWRGDQAASDSYLKELGAAMKPYHTGDYQTARQLLEPLAAKHPQAIEAGFYLGLSYLLGGDAASASRVLDRLPPAQGHPLDADIPWNRAAAYERLADWNRAKPLLAGLCSGNSSYRDRACELSRQ